MSTPTPRTDKWEHEQECNFEVSWEDNCRTLEAELAQAQAELDALREDKERLDFLDSSEWHGSTVGPYMGGENVRIQFGTRPSRAIRGIRAAIDAARKESK